MVDRQEFINQAKKQLDEFNSQLDELEDRMKDLTGEAKKIYVEQADDLRDILKEAKVKYDEARSASEETWQEVKGHLELTGKALRNSFNYFLSHYRKK